MIECCQSLRRVVEDDTSSLTSPNPAPFRFRSRTSSRSREKLARRSGVGCSTRAIAQLASSSLSPSCGLRSSSPRASTWSPLRSAPGPDIVHPCLAIMASAHTRREGPPRRAFFPQLDRSSLAAPPPPIHRRPVSRATVAERASTWKPNGWSLLPDGIHKGREPFLRDMPLIRIMYRNPSRDNHRGKFSRKLVSRGNFARGVARRCDTLHWIIFLSREINFPARATPNEYRID